jgi:hypothetical protein
MEQRQSHRLVAVMSSDLAGILARRRATVDHHDEAQYDAPADWVQFQEKDESSPRASTESWVQFGEEEVEEVRFQ